ncbi:MAG: hypothetical protein AAF543_00050 [Pseudomonadota bacterium]
MTRRRPHTRPDSSSAQRRPVADRDGGEGSLGIWYATLIGAVLLIATGIYAFLLHQEVETWRSAADQFEIGQELLRADRDEILQKARDQEVTLSTLEAARAQDRRRLENLETQRSRLQGDVLRLTQALAKSERQPNGAAERADPLVMERLRGERDRLEQELAERRAEIEWLETALSESEKALAERGGIIETREAELERLQAERADLDAAASALEKDKERLDRQIAERQATARRRQIIRGHRASLGEVKPYIAAVGPEDWTVIEGWLALQLGRPMAVPDLAAHGWSYEGARLLGLDDGPPMAMLLYADGENRPVSLTIARDGEGERALETEKDGGLDLLHWREERHVFFLAGEAGEETLEAVALELQNEPPRLSEDASVPVSRYVRPSFKPALEE